MILQQFKKAAIMISFSWIFMIIIGGFFLILAYNVIGKYYDNEEMKYDIELQQAIRSVLSNKGKASSGIENKLNPLEDLFRKSEVEILCVDNIAVLSINGKLDAQNQFFKNYPAFMTKINEGSVSKTYIAVENFKTPFKTTELLALVSTKNLIIFDTSSTSQNLATQFQDKFKKGSYEGLFYWFKDFSSNELNTLKKNIEDYSPTSVILVSSNPPSVNTLSKMQEINTMTYYVQINNNNKYGNISYFDKTGNNVGNYPYVDFDNKLSLPTMAIFSNPQTFECSYNLLFDSIDNTYLFYIEKTQKLKELSKTERTCSATLINMNSNNSIMGSFQVDMYQELEDKLNETRFKLKTQKFNNPQDVFNSINQVDQKAKLLEEQSCIYIY